VCVFVCVCGSGGGGGGGVLNLSYFAASLSLPSSHRGVRLWSRLWRCAVGEGSIALWQLNGNTVSGSYEKLHLFPSTDSVKGVCAPG